MVSHALPRVFVPLLALGVLACKSTQAPAPISASTPPAARDEPAAAKKGFEKIGVLAPVGAAAISLWPEAYSGSFVVLDVRPTGSNVEAGDVIAQLDTRAIDEEIRRAEAELRSKELALTQQRARNELDESSAQRALKNATAALDRAKRALDGYKEKELAFGKRQDELQKRYEQANLDDQRDELDQLEKMYKADELVDATEDIVIKRSRRSLDNTKLGNELSRDRARYREELEQSLQLESRTEEFQNRTADLAKLQATQALERESRADADTRAVEAAKDARTRLERLRRDRELFEIDAPRAGVLLHGALRDWRPSKAPARFERGSALTPRSDVFLIADPSPSAVALDVTDAEAARFTTNARVQVALLAGSEALVGGEISIDGYARNLTTNDAQLEATVRASAPLANARYGQRAKVTAVEDPR